MCTTCSASLYDSLNPFAHFGSAPHHMFPPCVVMCAGHPHRCKGSAQEWFWFNQLSGCGHRCLQQWPERLLCRDYGWPSDGGPHTERNCPHNRAQELHPATIPEPIGLLLDDWCYLFCRVACAQSEALVGARVSVANDPPSRLVRAHS